MNPLARAVMLGIAGLALVILFAAAAPTNEPPLPVPRLFADGSTNLFPAPFSFAPLSNPGRKPELSRPLAPGVYQIHPYDMILIATERGQDNRCVVGVNGESSRMPTIHPELRAVPILPPE
jgi:hypothetical protein